MEDELGRLFSFVLFEFYYSSSTFFHCSSSTCCVCCVKVYILLLHSAVAIPRVNQWNVLIIMINNNMSSSVDRTVGG